MPTYVSIWLDEGGFHVSERCLGLVANTAFLRRRTCWLNGWRCGSHSHLAKSKSDGWVRTRAHRASKLLRRRIDASFQVARSDWRSAAGKIGGPYDPKRMREDGS